MSMSIFSINDGIGDYYFPVNPVISYLIRDLAPNGQPVRDPGTVSNRDGLRFEVYVLTGTYPTPEHYELKLFRGAYAECEAACALIEQVVGKLENLPARPMAAITHSL